MRTSSVSEAKNSLSALLKLVQGGQEVIITDRDVPVARLVPVTMGSGIPPALLGLAQEGVARLPEREPDGSWLGMDWPSTAKGTSGSDALIAERGTGR